MQRTKAADSGRVLIRAGSALAGRRWSRGGARLSSVRRPVDIREVRRETPDCVTLVLQPADGKALPFAAGQYLTLYADIEGRPLRRAYSISEPQQAAVPAVTIKAVAGGAFSHWALHEAAPGMRLYVAGPTGTFTLPDAAADTHCVFAAAGSGITPIMSLIETRLRECPEAPVTLHYGSRREAEIIFRERLDAMAAGHPCFTLRHSLSRPEPGWTGAQGRLDPEALLGAADPATAHYFLCGPGDCIDTLSDGLRAAGVDAGRIHSERFTAGVHAVRAHPTDPHPVLFTRTGKEVTVRPGESVLEAGLRSGLELPFSCTMGGCGHCKLQKRAGHVVTDEPNCLDETEAAQGWFLACCSYPTGRLEVAA